MKKTAGRKPIHAYHSLKVGQKAKLEGSAQDYPYQFINQFNINKAPKKLKVIIEDGFFYAKRIV